ncbi:two-component response regulator-like APRR5 [Tanacetum coccineum]
MAANSENDVDDDDDDFEENNVYLEENKKLNLEAEDYKETIMFMDKLMVIVKKEQVCKEELTVRGYCIGSFVRRISISYAARDAYVEMHLDQFEEIKMAEESFNQHKRSTSEKESADSSGAVDLRHFSFYAFAGRTGTLFWSQKNENIEAGPLDESPLTNTHTCTKALHVYACRWLLDVTKSRTDRETSTTSQMTQEESVKGIKQLEMIVGLITEDRRSVLVGFLKHRANNFYYPRWEPKKGGLNKFNSNMRCGRVQKNRSWHLSHKMPYNIWSGGYNSIIAKGIRFYADKKQVRNYYSTMLLNESCILPTTDCHSNGSKELRVSDYYCGCFGWFEGIGGFALLTLIMEHEVCKNIPVIMMSAHDSVSTVYKCMLKGAANFLVKPVQKNELKNLWQHVWGGLYSHTSLHIHGASFKDLPRVIDGENNKVKWELRVISTTVSPEDVQILRLFQFLEESHALFTSIEGRSLEAEAKLHVVDAKLEGCGKTS